MGEEKAIIHFTKEKFQNDLLSWFENNMRDLPWRRDKDPYKIWVSEIMLQQTKVDTVIPYFNRFIANFPSIEALANASEDEVLKNWEGLGYYSRARNLQAAVREVKENYGGQVPSNKKELSSLKGVGPYTTGAILSIAFDQSEPAVDGNVMRVFSRIFAIDEDIQKAKTRILFEELVQALIPTGSPSFFNQAIMELGALICHPKSPKCSTCPVSKYCKARKLGLEQSLPIKQKKKKPTYKKMVAGVLIVDKYVLIRQRNQEGLLSKLYEFPNLEWEGEEEAATRLSQHMYQMYKIKTETRAQLEGVQHIFSHLIWDITVYQLKVLQDDSYIHRNSTTVDDKTFELEEAAPFIGGYLPEDSYWVRIDELDQYAFPVSHQKIKQQISNLN